MAPAEDGDRIYRERFYTSQDNLRLYHRDYGAPCPARPTVLCLSGLTRNSKDFHELAAMLLGHWRVLCPDYRGRGRSQYDANWRNYRPQVYLDDVRHLLAARNVHKVVVVGTSLGGLLAMAMSVAMPCVLAGAVLNDIGPTIEPAGLVRILAYMDGGRTQPDWETAARHLRNAQFDQPTTTEDQWLDVARRTYKEQSDGQLSFDWDVNLSKTLRRKGQPNQDFWPLFRALRRIPVLAVRGAKSDILSESTFDQMADQVPRLDRITVPDVGHVPSLREPEVVAAIKSLLDRAG